MPGSGRHDATPVERALSIARRNRVLLLVCFIVVPVAALAYSLAQTPEYTASASLLFAESNPSEADPERSQATNLELISLDQVAARTARAFRKSGLSPEAIFEKVSASGTSSQSNLVKISATDSSASFAARLANQFARQVIAFRRDSSRAKIMKEEALVESSLAELAPAQRAGPEGRALEAQKRRLRVRAALQTGEAQLVQPATTPTSPSSPKKTRNVALGILLGLVLGISLALLRDQFDRRVKTEEEAEEAIGLSTIATVPHSRQLEGDAAKKDMPVGEGAEAFRMLRANLQYFGIEEPMKSILVTSPSSEDGKTMVAWNLALAETRSEKQVLFIEADLRRPTVLGPLEPTDEKGLSTVLAGRVDAQEALRQVRGVDVLPAGPLPPNPAELIESQRMEQLLEWASAEYDRVIVDTPPTTVVADAVPVVRWVDRVLVVVRLGRTRRDAAEHMREQLAHIAAPVIGVVVNGVAEKSDDRYYRSAGVGNAFRNTRDETPASGAGRTAPQGLS